MCAIATVLDRSPPPHDIFNFLLGWGGLVGKKKISHLGTGVVQFPFNKTKGIIFVVNI